MGASYEEYLTPKASVLICNEPETASQEKLRHTAEWGVPAVSADWLWISIQAGQKKAFEPYIVRRQPSQSANDKHKTDGAQRSGKQQHQQIEKPNAEDFRASAVLPSEKTVEKPLSGNPKHKRMMRIIGDGFSNEVEANIPPKPSIPNSRSPSPDLTVDKPQADEPPKQQEAAQPAPSALDTALKGLLQQAQAAKSRQQAEDSNPDVNDSYPPRRKRKPLLGRAPSNPATRTMENPGTLSRASSIDTLNDDGLGSALESADPTRDNSLSRTTSRNDPSLSSMFSGKKFEFLTEKLPAHTEGEDEENPEPPMTQLDYEDPDAAAMRVEFLRNAGKLVGKPKPDSGFLGEVRELEDIGWASGRRTRKQPRTVDE